MLKKLLVAGVLVAGAGIYVKDKYGKKLEDKLEKYAVYKATQVVDKHLAKLVDDFADGIEDDDWTVSETELLDSFSDEDLENLTTEEIEKIKGTRPVAVYDFFKEWSKNHELDDTIASDMFKDSLDSESYDVVSEAQRKLYHLYANARNFVEDLPDKVAEQFPDVFLNHSKYPLDLETLSRLTKQYHLSDKVLDDIIDEGIETFEVLPVIVPKDAYEDASVLYAGTSKEPVYQDASKVFDGELD